MIKAYFYPNPSTKESLNPYITEFINSLSTKIEFCNLKTKYKSGILDAFRFFWKIDVLFLNWIEDLPDKRGGFLQSFALIILVYIIKIKKTKIFYTLHNKESHYKSHRILKNFLRSFILKKADCILCHSTEGKAILTKLNLPEDNFQYHPHPFYVDKLFKSTKNKEYDILIWGAIRPYKGIDKYLKYLQSRGLLSRYKTKIVGSILPVSYENELNQYKSTLIEIENVYIENETLDELIDISRIVLFTYDESSILSSGAVIYSLGRGANIIGPNAASFRDLNKEGLIHVYNDFEDLIRQIDYTLIHSDITHEKIASYIEMNTWSKFGDRIMDWMKKEGLRP